MMNNYLLLKQIIFKEVKLWLEIASLSNIFLLHDEKYSINHKFLSENN